MKKLKIIFIVTLLFLSLPHVAQTTTSKDEGGLVWYTDIMKASEVSKTSNKPLFAFFTGSDWCVWCRKVQNDVFTKSEFIAWAKKNVVLLELDFPRGKQQSPELMQQNAGLQQSFQVRGYPTIWLFFLKKSADGLKFDIDALGSLGYPQGSELGKEEVKFIADANSLLAKRNLK